jgi:glutathione-specific gamma-glutamylcyclotransferase
VIGYQWVFGYGSLMWRPGFEADLALPAVVAGYQRALCVRSESRWGAPHCPGLVMGLLPGGSCEGVALGVRPERFPEVRRYLDRREGRPYVAQTIEITTARGSASAIVYAARPDHPLFAGELTPEEAARMVAEGKGAAGSSWEYLESTLRHLGATGITDPPLLAILEAARCRRGESRE